MHFLQVGSEAIKFEDLSKFTKQNFGNTSGTQQGSELENADKT